MASLVSLTSMSPRITARISRSSCSSSDSPRNLPITNRAFAVLLSGISRSRASASMVGVSGVATRSVGCASSGPAAALANWATCAFAEYPHPGQWTMLSSPTAVR